MAVSESHGYIVVLSMRLSVLTVWNCPPPRCVATALAMEGFSATHSTFVTTMLSMNTLRLRAPPFHVRLWDGVDEDVAESKQKLGTRRGRRAPSGSTHVCLRQIHSRNGSSERQLQQKRNLEWRLSAGLVRHTFLYTTCTDEDGPRHLTAMEEEEEEDDGDDTPTTWS